jgi:hypothetical protein
VLIGDEIDRCDDVDRKSTSPDARSGRDFVHPGTMPMKVIEQIVRHLSECGSLSNADVAWLRAEGFIPSLDDDQEDVNERETWDGLDASALATLLEKLEERQIQVDLHALRNSSTGSRRARGRRQRRMRRKS